MLRPAKQTENQATKTTATNGSFFGRGGSAPFFQAKLTVNEPGDADEQEADRVSDQVMRMKEDEEPVVQRTPLTPVSRVQRMCADCEEKQEAGVPRKETAVNHGVGSSAPSIVGQVLSSGGGQTMDAGTRQFMESRFGQDFGQVRIHTNARAAESAAAIQAKAYTSGRDIVFGGGEYRPESSEGKRLLAHELVHVGQQNGNTIQRKITAQPANISTPVPKTANLQSNGVAILWIKGIKVIIEPDTVSEEEGTGAVTTITPSGGDVSSYDYNTSNNLVTKAGTVSPIVVNIKTVYQKGANPAGNSAYGRGTTADDQKAGNISLKFHEGRHGEDFMRYLQNHPLPVFGGKKGMTVEAYDKAVQDFLAAQTKYFENLDTDSETRTDCVGTPAHFCKP